MAAAGTGQPPPEAVQFYNSSSPLLKHPNSQNKIAAVCENDFRRNGANSVVVQPCIAAGQLPSMVPTPPAYDKVLRTNCNASGGADSAASPPPLASKQVTYLHGEPTFLFEESEIEESVVRQNLKWAVIGKFTHGMPEIEFLRTEIPKQLKLKAHVNIGYLFSRHVLIRCSIMEDYDTLMSINGSFDIKLKNTSYPMRSMKYDVNFDPTKETSIAWVWISFPNLPPIYFEESILLSFASVVGRPICVDAATKNKTRPSCARVKVELDLLREHPKQIQIQIAKEGGIQTNSYKIQFDYLPKYCTNCSLQGHDVHGCWKLNPSLRPSKEKESIPTPPMPSKDNTQIPTPPINLIQQTPKPKNPNQTNFNPKNSNDWQVVVGKKRKQKSQQIPKIPSNKIGTKNPSQKTKQSQNQPLHNTTPTIVVTQPLLETTPRTLSSDPTSPPVPIQPATQSPPNTPYTPHPKPNPPPVTQPPTTNNKPPTTQDLIKNAFSFPKSCDLNKDFCETDGVEVEESRESDENIVVAECGIVNSIPCPLSLALEKHGSIGTMSTVEEVLQDMRNYHPHLTAEEYLTYLVGTSEDEREMALYLAGSPGDDVAVSLDEESGSDESEDDMDLTM